MPNPLENKLLLYYLNELGSGLADEGDPMQKVAGATRQNIATQNYMNLIKQMLAGGGKFSMDKDKFKLDAPSTLLGDVSGLSKQQQTPFAGAPAGMSMNAPGEQLETKEDRLKHMFLNPSASPLDISSADLAGLTPENISQALQLKLTSEELERKRLSDIYKMMQPAEAKDTRTTKVKTYEYAKEQGYKGSFVDFQNISETTHKKDYDEAVKDGYVGSFNNWMLEMAKAGAINLGEVTKREVAKRKGIGESEVMAPGFAQSIKIDLMKDKANWPSESLIKQYTGKGLPYIEAEERAQKRMVLETMDRQIRQAFKGKKVTLGEEGWEVDGELKVRYP